MHRCFPVNFTKLLLFIQNTNVGCFWILKWNKGGLKIPSLHVFVKFKFFYTLLVTSPANIYLLKVNNNNTVKRCEICSKVTMNTRERGKWRSVVFNVNFEHISYLFLMFLLLTLNSWVFPRREGLSCSICLRYSSVRRIWKHVQTKTTK